MFFFGMNKTLKTYLKLIVKPHVELTTYYSQNSSTQKAMREQFFSDVYAACYVFSLVFIAVQKNQMSNPTKHYCDAYDYLFGSGGRGLLKLSNEFWNDPDKKNVADEMFAKAKADVSLITLQLESGQTPIYDALQELIEGNPFLNEIENL